MIQKWWRTAVILALLAIPVLLSASSASSSDISRYDFTYYIYGESDCYVGYVYAPTGMMTAGTTLYREPDSMGGYTLDGGYYYITNVTNGYSSAYDKQSYITSYYDASLGSWLNVNGDGSTTAGSIYVADRSTTNEYGYALYNSTPGFFDNYNQVELYSTNGVTRYDFYFYYTDGSGDYYQGYIYLPTAYESNMYLQTHSTEPTEMGSGSLNGYYYFYSKTSGYSWGYNMRGYVTQYHDSSLNSWLGVNSDGSTTASSAYCGNRFADDEYGYAIYGSTVKYFDPYSSASF